jgi:hypothetical protein
VRVNRILKGLRTNREGVTRNRKGFSEEWKRLQRIRDPVWKEVLAVEEDLNGVNRIPSCAESLPRAERGEVFPVGLDWKWVNRISCPLRQEASRVELNRETMRPIRRRGMLRVSL